MLSLSTVGVRRTARLQGLTGAVLCKPTGGFLDTSYQYDTSMVGVVIGGIVVFVLAFGLTWVPKSYESHLAHRSYSHLVWYQSELLPLEIRAVGSAIATTCAWLGQSSVGERTSRHADTQVIWSSRFRICRCWRPSLPLELMPSISHS